MGRQKKGVVDPLMAIVTPIQALEGEVTVGQDAAFFYAKGHHLFLITNRHVVTQEEGEPNSLKIKVRADPKDLRTSVGVVFYLSPQGHVPYDVKLMTKRLVLQV